MRAAALALCAGCSSLLGLDDYRARDSGSLDADSSLPSDAGGIDAAMCTSSEACTAPSAPERAVDEDCDGWIDEDCDWSVAIPHWLTVTQLGLSVGSPWLSPDGLRLYFVNRTAGKLWMTQRTSTRDPFMPPTEVMFATPGVLRIEAVTLSSDEREIILDVHDGNRDLLFSTRDSRDVEFLDLQPLPLDRGEAGLDAAPALSADGNELFFVSDRSGGPPSIHLSVRDRDGGFTAAQLVSFDRAFTGTDSPALSLDGRTLFFRGHEAGGAQLFYATRARRGEASFATPTRFDVPGLAEGAHYHFFLSERTAELFFVSDREWSPGDASIWRTRLCRSASCTVESVACEVGQRSPDQQHCYFAPDKSAPLAWDAAQRECASLTDSGSVTHLPTVHSAPEAGLSQEASGAAAWVGAQETLTGVAWITGEPEPHGLFPTPTLGGDECAAIPTGGPWPGVYPLALCTASRPFVCEREAWPIW